MKILPFNGWIPDLNKIRFDDALYEKMKEDFNSLLEQGVFTAVSNIPSFYLLSISDGDRHTEGIVCMTPLAEYTKNHIRRHEQTMAKKEKLHRRLLRNRKAMIKPAALIIEFNRSLQYFIRRIKSTQSPLYTISYPTSAIQQRLWAIHDSGDIAKIQAIFKDKLRYAVIADGHHRFASLAANSITGKDSLLTVYFDPDQMQLSSFYRIIRPIPRFSGLRLLEVLKNRTLSFKKVNLISNPTNYAHLIFNGEIFRFKLAIKKNELIAHAFAREITQGVFQISNEAQSKRIQYLEVDRPTDSSALSDDYPDQYIFLLPGMKAKEILRTGKVLPPKSTFFMPRILNGLIIALQ
jgi:uncharacterized protein (DUF1015 family)